MQQISNIQKTRDSQSALDKIKKNITEMCDRYDVIMACLSGNSADIYKDNISRGYFEILESYESVTEAIKNMKLGYNILIRENCCYLGIVRNTINECSETGTIINLYSNRFVKMKEGAVRMCDLDDIHTPKQMMVLYEKVAESVPEIKSILEGIEVPEFNPDLDCRRWIEDTWNKVHESLDIPEENKIIENISYTNFSI